MAGLKNYLITIAAAATLLTTSAAAQDSLITTAIPPALPAPETVAAVSFDDPLSDDAYPTIPAPKALSTENLSHIIASAPENAAPENIIILNLEKCIKQAIDNNHELRMKLADLNSVDGDQMVDRSRFYSHIDFVADASRNQGSLLKSYNPTLNPPVISPIGMDSSSIGQTLSGGSSSSSGTDLSALASQYGVDLSQVTSLASQYGIDISKYLQRTTSAGTSAQRSANAIIPGTNIDTDDLEQLFEETQNIVDYFNDTIASASRRSTSNIQAGFRFSQRLLEWGRDPASTIQVRQNRRLATYNYEQKLRDVISQVRSAFFLIILKQQQIETRQKLLKEYQAKLVQQQKRFEIAKDVPRIDVLTAELDVLNEQNRIDVLNGDLTQKKLELLQLLNLPYDTNVQFVGDIPSFDFTLPEIVSTTKQNSYQMTYLNSEFDEAQLKFQQLAWDYKPVFSAKVGYEDHRNAYGLTLNNSNQTYGLDLGAINYINVPSERTSSSLISSLTTTGGTRTSDDNLSIAAGLTWNLYDNTQRKGVEKKQLENLNKLKIDLTRQTELEELSARKAYNDLVEAVQKLTLQSKIVDNAKRRLEITRKLREYGKVTEYQVDSYRDSFFSQQDRYFSDQEAVITAQENLRKIMGTF